VSDDKDNIAPDPTEERSPREQVGIAFRGVVVVTVTLTESSP
jgi:hypothetical protein